MCGIYGEIRFDSQQASLKLAQDIIEKMRPRGPDASGLWSQDGNILGHTRLKIIDLSEKAQQPMVDSQLGLSIVFNGMIYNYPELREELIQKGYRFFSEGDTEVILKAYHAWGEDFVKKLSGMFAFAIYERDSKKIILARDRLGIKPLYYSQVVQSFRFASSLPALLLHRDIDLEIDSIALHHYMHFHSVVPPPFTMLKGIRKLKPAHIMIIDAKGSLTEKCYWNPDFVSHNSSSGELSFEEYQTETLRLLKQSVERRLIADVPVGVLLSGGLDSSLVVGLLANLGAKGLNTFSIGFDAVAGEAGDEFFYSDIIAKHFGTEHHQIRVDPIRTLKELPNCIAAMSEPMVSHDNIGFYLLSQEVAKHIKVVQSGQGADEIFAGYHWYPPMMESTTPLETYQKYFFDRNHQEYTQVVHSRFHEKDYSSKYVEDFFNQSKQCSSIDQALRLDSLVMLVDDPVKRVDNMTMAWGLEARVPFLDHDLVEWAAKIPAKYKVKQGGKFILKEVARKIIPHEVIDRPKGYFPVPALKFIQGRFLEFVTDFLYSKKSKERALFQEGYVAKLVKSPQDFLTPLKGSKLWQLALLEAWLSSQGA